MKEVKKQKPITQMKLASRTIFSLKPTKIKPSKKIYSRKGKNDHSGIFFHSVFQSVSPKNTVSLSHLRF
ncbi:hypothetical protein EHQ46_17680 [Leptospira yanagawae]|uniref:Uncharacterized protein n=1 Tax=Leptospira yanagawae TaxID=293069 RepID=A0ABY2LX21_9LEPT|nr:hypothetical protein EHQ46_17680 [Leptospira yanagawae]